MTCDPNIVAFFGDLPVHIEDLINSRIRSVLKCKMGATPNRERFQLRTYAALEHDDTRSMVDKFLFV